MDALIDFILGVGVTEFTPRALVGYMVFVCILDSISMLISSFTRGVHAWK